MSSIVRRPVNRLVAVLSASLTVLVATASLASAQQTFGLRVNVFVDATGTVTSSPAGINCTTAKYNPIGGLCGADFPVGTVVTLTATPGEQNTFQGWSGDCTGLTCQVTMDRDHEVRPNFVATRYPVTVVGAGNGQGTIHEPLGETYGQPPLACGIRNGVALSTTCTTTVAYNSVLKLVFETNVGGTNLFRGFSSECAITGGFGPCNARITGPTTITATIVADEFRVRSAGGNGSGTVTNTTGNATINCTITSTGESGTCGKIYDRDTPSQITLVATPAEGSRFVGWSGACTTDPCQFIVDYPPNVPEAFARFEALPEGLLRLTVNGTGGFGRGRVTSSPAGIDCDFSNPASTDGTGTCEALFNVGTTVQLTATPRDGTKALGFTGDCASTSATCTVDMYHDRRATVRLDPARFPVTIVGGPGNGTGVITALNTNETPKLICEIFRGLAATSGCATVMPFGATLVLVEATRGSSKFIGFGVPPCVDSSQCSVSVTGPLTISAGFVAPEINIVGNGTGSGRVQANGIDGLDCTVSPSGSSGECSRISDSRVATSLSFLTIVPSPGSVFVGWSGLCTGTGGCTTFGDFPPNTQLVARFDLADTPPTLRTLTVSAAGQGSGAVQSSPAGITCTITNGAAQPHGCSAEFPQDQLVTLTAATSFPYRFVGWIGPCDGTDPCVVKMSQTVNVAARFERDDDAVAVTIVGGGTGNGTVNVSPGSIPCPISGGAVVDGATCTVVYATPRQVVLTATPQFGSTFGGWSGEGCTTTELQCIFTLSSSRTIVATFISPHSPHDLALALVGTFKLLPGEAAALDRLGNKDGTYDIGDLLAYLDRTGQKLTATDAARVMKAPQTPVAPTTTRRVP